MTDYRDCYFTNRDGLRLHYRDYDHAGSGAPTVLCLPGLTRNARDFRDVADQLKQSCRVICAEQRGRGLSEWDKDPSRYTPVNYVLDMLELLDHIGTAQVHIVATSLGGLMTMIMEATKPGTVLSAVINDIGPHVEEEGVNRLKEYVGVEIICQSWEEARQKTKAMAGHVYPDFTDEQWMDFTTRLFAEKKGAIKLDYDPAIATPFNANSDEAAPDLWAIFDALKPVPLLVIHGATSDILSAKTLNEMKTAHPDMTSVTVPRVGHAPMLYEPQVIQAMNHFAQRHYNNAAPLRAVSAP